MISSQEGMPLRRKLESNLGAGCSDQKRKQAENKGHVAEEDSYEAIPLLGGVGVGSSKNGRP